MLYEAAYGPSLIVILKIAKLAVMIKTKIAIQGQEGSFHAEAATRLFGSDVELIGCPNFTAAFKAVSSGQADHAVVAIENSLYGTINDTYDLLSEQHAWVAGEVYLEIHHQLIGLPSSELSQINEVHSQAPALGQCRAWLEQHLPHAKLIEESDTAGSVALVKSWNDPAKAAIASKAAADLHQLPILAADIEDHHRNYTRFIRLDAQRPANLSQATKTSLALVTDHTPGSLVSALAAFSDLGMNMTMLHSRPIPTDAWHYTFYLDVEAGIGDTSLSRALEILKTQNCQVTIFGSYPKANLSS